jgi:hypothetical protein
LSFLQRELRCFLGTYRDSVRIWRLAPLIPLIAVLPEFTQHVVEIGLGMFESRDAFRALAMDPLRMSFGVLKIAGLIAAILVSARFWANREAGARWWSLAGIGWRQVLLGIAVQVAASVPGLVWPDASPQARMIGTVLLSVLSLPGLVLIVGGLVGDRSLGLLGAYRRGGAAPCELPFTSPLAGRCFRPCTSSITPLRSARRRHWYGC